MGFVGVDEDDENPPQVFATGRGLGLKERKETCRGLVSLIYMQGGGQVEVQNLFQE